MSFAIDAPGLVGIGVATALLTDDGKTRAAIGGGTLAAFYGVSLSMYFEAGWARPFWRITGAKSGRDWMINSRIFRFDTSTMSTKNHFFAAAIFASYPIWLLLGIALGDVIKVRRGRKS
ncbi:MAG: hypothetical protein C4318_08830 [Acidimicrobiia bacterium]